MQEKAAVYAYPKIFLLAITTHGEHIEFGGGRAAEVLWKAKN
jgi:hypothetical protein